MLLNHCLYIPFLVLFEYGLGIDETKLLVDKLDMLQNVFCPLSQSEKI